MSLPKELVKKLDVQAKKEFSSRSEFVRRAVINQLRADETKVLDKPAIKDEYEAFKKQYHQALNNLATR